MTRKQKWRLALVVLLLSVAALWLLPADGLACDEITDCHTAIALDVEALGEDVNDWEPQPGGLTLSPDKTEAAVVVRSDDLDIYRLATFSLADGSLLAFYEAGDADYFDNPVYSPDGSQLAAVTGVGSGEDFARGDITVWDHDSTSVTEQLWSWPEEGEERSSRSASRDWDSCRTDMGFSNDGLAISCGQRLASDGSTTSGVEQVSRFTSLPSGYRIANQVVDTSRVFPSRARFNRSDSTVTLRPSRNEGISSGGLSVDANLDGTTWRAAAVALRSDGRFSVIARQWDGSFVRNLLPRYTRAPGHLTVARVAPATVEESHRLALTPAAVRYSPPGAGFAVIGTNFDLWIFSGDIIVS